MLLIAKNTKLLIRKKQIHIIKSNETLPSYTYHIVQLNTWQGLGLCGYDEHCIGLPTRGYHDGDVSDMQRGIHLVETWYKIYALLNIVYHITDDDKSFLFNYSPMNNIHTPV